ncbi:hypothetical protein KL866_08505 [Alteromonas sp. ALT199]|uniref:hypothetical protein n=1 Tax=Alteromonas sp. ALT199 TaxID=1298865 RepID=UPI001BE74683|nr:hypothetical protein [Alteromonas sp. ALT199]MBT3135144.1 hypothetical protein [Alteromonas sp. ALT199]
MPELYRNKIVEAFRDNAIRSVLLIDDEYLPFENLVASSSSFRNELEAISADVNPTTPDKETVYQARLSKLQTLLTQASSNLMRSMSLKNSLVSFMKNDLSVM